MLMGFFGPRKLTGCLHFRRPVREATTRAAQACAQAVLIQLHGQAPDLKSVVDLKTVTADGVLFEKPRSEPSRRAHKRRKEL